MAKFHKCIQCHKRCRCSSKRIINVCSLACKNKINPRVRNSMMVCQN